MKGFYGTPFSKTATHATDAVATQTGVALQTHYITDLSASSDKAGSIVLVKDGTTTIWQDIVGAVGSGGHYEISFITPLKATAGADISVTIDGTAACKANMSGFTLNNS